MIREVKMPVSYFKLRRIPIDKKIIFPVSKDVIISDFNHVIGIFGKYEFILREIRYKIYVALNCGTYESMGFTNDEYA